MSFILNIFFAIQAAFLVNPAIQPQQPLIGPGGADYVCTEVKSYDYADSEKGFWLYEPVSDQIDTAHLIVFIHGYGALNPMIYGGWIKHLVQKGNVVLFPRYQKGIFSTPAKDFPENTVSAIKAALEILKEKEHIPVYENTISLVGHSYGGVISANLANYHEVLGIPFPQAVFLCSPGSGPLRGAVLKSYDKIPSRTKLLIMHSERDHVVGDKLAKRVFATATQVTQRNLIKQYSDSHGEPGVSSGHNESYSIDQDFDGGIYNTTVKRAKRIGQTNAVDYYGYWKLYDALLDCARSNTNCDFAFGDTPQQRSLGKWSDGKAIHELEITLP